MTVTRAQLVEHAARLLCAQAGMDPDAEALINPPPGWKGIVTAQGLAKIKMYQLREQEVDNYLRLTEVIRLAMADLSNTPPTSTSLSDAVKLANMEEVH